MARSIPTIQASIIAAKNADANLSGLTSNSNVALWQLITYVVAVAMFTLESLWDLMVVQLNGIAANAPAGTCGWYQKQVLAFQYNYTISFGQYNNPIYATIDATAQIVTQCSVTANQGQITIRAATGTAPNFTALSAAQLTALKSYINAISFAGDQITTVSLNADELLYDYTIYYNGQLDVTAFTTAVQAAINTYLAALPFNGNVEQSALEAAILAVPGVNYLNCVSLAARNGTGAYNTWNTVYQTEAGYIVADNTSTFNLIPQ